MKFLKFYKCFKNKAVADIVIEIKEYNFVC